jgi:hypothetical protein
MPEQSTKKSSTGGSTRPTVGTDTPNRDFITSLRDASQATGGGSAVGGSTMSAAEAEARRKEHTDRTTNK